MVPCRLSIRHRADPEDTGITVGEGYGNGTFQSTPPPPPERPSIRPVGTRERATNEKRRGRRGEEENGGEETMELCIIDHRLRY